MNGRETATAEAAIDNEPRAHLVDAEAIRRALRGDPKALTELEQGAVVSIVDMDGMSREMAAAGLGITSGNLDKRIGKRRRLAGFAYRRALAAGTRGRARDFAGAVRARDVAAVAEVLTELDTQGLYALAIVLADMVPREPDADNAPTETSDPQANMEAAPP